MKQKIIGIISLMTVMLFAFATATLGVGDFVIQNALFDQIFTVNGTSNITLSSGEIYENSTALKEVYWQIISTATPANGEGNLSTADQIYDFVIGQGYTTTAWNSLENMTLADGDIYIGNSSNNPQGQTLSGDLTINSTGYVTLAAAIMRDAEIETWGYWNESTDVDDDEITEAKIAFSTACAAGNHYFLNGNDLDCETDDDTTYTVATPLNMTGTLIDLIACADTEIYKYNTTAGDWNCAVDAGAGISNVVEDTTPQLGGNLDVNDFGIDGGGSTNMTIDASGNFIIILA